MTRRRFYCGVATPEMRVLLLCARRRLGASQSSELREILRTPLDWRYLIAAAGKHGLLALLYSGLKSGDCLPLLPSPILTKLQAAVREATGKTLARTAELTRILEAFRSAEIPAMPCKGPIAALMAYGDISFRSFCDLDILVDLGDLDRARRQLQLLGYKPYLPINAQQERDYLNNECALQFRNEVREHIVELHWRFSERNASVDLPVESFWRRAQKISVAGMETLALCPEDLVLYLCVHGAKHRWERIEWIACLAGVLDFNPELDWKAIFKRSRQYRVA